MNIFLRLLLAAALGSSALAADSKLIVHEWGTFTALQDEAGNAVPGVNTDDEPVPRFVHDLARRLLIPPTEVPPTFFQGAPACHPDVTMRLETPVVYFHAPESFRTQLDVQVKFRSGWLTQFYPQATALAAGIDPESGRFGHLSAETVSSLTWTRLQINASGVGPETDAHVWLAPRAVDALTVQSAEGEQEKFLFYRGVAHLDAPVRVARSDDGATLEITREGEVAIGQMWLVDIRPDGSAAWRAPDGKLPVQTAATFPPEQYSRDAVAGLRSSLKAALLAAGLFADEADALLNTWQLSYFQSAGLRLFFMVPREWTDRVLPLEISDAAELTRVMVGRIELVTPEQRTLLRKLAQSPVPDPWEDIRKPADVATYGAGNNQAGNELFEGKRSFASIGVELPPAYSIYLALGRFRNALLLDEQRRRPNETLARFIETFRLGAYQPDR